MNVLDNYWDVQEKPRLAKANSSDYVDINEYLIIATVVSVLATAIFMGLCFVGLML